MNIQQGDYMVVDRPEPHGPFGAIAIHPERRGEVYAINEFGNVTTIKISRILEHWKDCPIAAGKLAYSRFLTLTRRRVEL